VERRQLVAFAFCGAETPDRAGWRSAAIPLRVVSDGPSLSVVIPAYNEEASIELCITTLEIVLRDITDDFEIIVVDDGSQDRTAAILDDLSRSRPHLITIHHEHNRGLGAGLRSGFSRSSKSLTFYSDADLPFDFVELVRAIRVMHFKHADVVTGFRHDRTNEGLKRILYSFAYNWLIRIVFGVKIKDVNFSFKLMRTDRLHGMDLRSEGSFIDAEMMIYADRLGLFICQIGVDYFKRRHGHSHLSSVSTILKIIQEMAHDYPRLRRIRPLGS
jgi:glycosyltransferase involved in cell wall biosynthesis